MQRIGKILKIAIPAILAILALFYGISSDSPLVKIGQTTSVEVIDPLKFQIDSLNSEIAILKNKPIKIDTIYRTSKTTVPVVVYADRVVGVKLDSAKVHDLDLSNYDIENPVSDSAKDYVFDAQKYLELPYAFELKNEGISFNAEITKDSFLLKNLQVQSPFTIEQRLETIDKYQDRTSVMFKYANPALQNLNISYQEKPHITDAGLKKIKRKTALKTAAWSVSATSLTAILLKVFGVWK